jgi:hypothetical protein
MMKRKVGFFNEMTSVEIFTHKATDRLGREPVFELDRNTQGVVPVDIKN